jgi:phenylalanine-4-hydroxylase
MCLDRHGHRKAYGAGILSSLGELEYCQTDKPTFKSLDPYKIAQDHLYYPTNEMQPIYFVAESFEKAKNQISLYCNNI